MSVAKSISRATGSRTAGYRWVICLLLLAATAINSADRQMIGVLKPTLQHTFSLRLPDFFAKRHHLDLKSFGPPLVIIYVASDMGAVVGGWIPQTVGSYTPIFAGCALLNLVALGAIHLLSPRLAPAQLSS